MLGQRITTMRAIMAVLAPMTGKRASGSALVKSTTGGNVTLPARAYAAPILASATGKSQIARDMMVLTSEQTEVTPAGISVPVVSLLGGLRNNFAAGTKFRWDPQLTGIELVSDQEGALTGGLDPTGDASVRQILALEELGSADKAAQFFAAGLQGIYPAIAIAWNGSPQTSKVGMSVWLSPDRWILYIVVERQEGMVERGYEGLNILDLAEGYLGDREAVDGAAFSDPHTRIVGAARHSVTPSSYVYSLTIETNKAMSRIDTRAEDGKSAKGPIASWARTRYDVSVATTPAYPLVVDAESDQP